MNVFLAGLLKDWRFWVVVALIVGGVIVYNAGKSKGLSTPPEDAPYIETKTVSENAVFAEWAKTTGNSWVEKANSFFTSWTSWFYYGTMRDLIFSMATMTDNQIIYINNTYNRRYFKTGSFLTQLYDHKLYDSSDYDSVIQRLIKNKAK